MTATMDRPTSAHYTIPCFLLSKPAEIIAEQDKQRIEYAKGSATIDPADWPAQYTPNSKGIDDAGELQLLLAHAAGIDIPNFFGGIFKWLEDSEFAKAIITTDEEYVKCVTRESSSRCYICVAVGGNRNAPADYIWGVIDGKTLESHPAIGPVSRPFNAPGLAESCHCIYRIY